MRGGEAAPTHGSTVKGLALIAKGAGITSFQALGPLKRGLGTDRLGHCGTLDRFASGLLVAAIGSYTKLVRFLVGLDKVYVARLRLGIETDTLDPEGAIVAVADPPGRAAFEAALEGFRGEIQQAPPAYSALHIDGVRASVRARRGELVEPAPRSVTIRELALIDFEGEEATLLISCSSGTYIRSLARDIAKACGSRAHLLELERRSIGPFQLRAALPFDSEWSPDLLLPLDPATCPKLGLEPVGILDSAMRRFRDGSPLAPDDFLPLPPRNQLVLQGRALAVFDGEGRLVGGLEPLDGAFRRLFTMAAMA